MTATGLGKGLAVKHDFRADIQNLYARENLKTQIQVEKQQKARFYGEMLKKGHVRGDYNNQRLEEYYNGLNDQLADFVTENPGWETDPGLFSQFANITDKYINNDIIREDVQVQEQFQALQGAINSGNMRPEDIEKNMAKYTDYIENGGNPYMFYNPKQISFNDVMANVVQQTGMKSFTETVDNIEYSILEPLPGAIEESVRTQWNDPMARNKILENYEKEGGAKVATNAFEYAVKKAKHMIDTKKIKTGYDDLYLARTRAALSNRNQNQITPSRFGTDIFEQYYADQLAGVDSNIPGGNQNFVFTTASEGDAKFIDATDEILLQPIDSTGNAVGDPSAFKNSMIITPTSAGNFKTVAGMPYIEVSAKVYAKMDDKGNFNSTLIDELTTAGFAPSKVTTEGMFEEIVFDSKNIRAKTYSGKILMPANLEYGNMLDYDRQFTTEAQAQKNMFSPQYPGFISSMNDLGKFKEFGPLSQGADGFYYNESKTVRIDPETQEVFKKTE